MTRHHHPHSDEPVRSRRVERHEETPLFTDPTLNFDAEGGFLEMAEKHADALERRERLAARNVRTFRMSRDEFRGIAEHYARVVAIARAYWLAEANRRAELARKETAA